MIFQNSHEPRVNPCKVTVDTEADKVILSIPSEKIGISLNFDEVLSIMAQAIVLFHQRHDGKGGGAMPSKKPRARTTLSESRSGRLLIWRLPLGSGPTGARPPSTRRKSTTSGSTTPNC